MLVPCSYKTLLSCFRRKNGFINQIEKNNNDDVPGEKIPLIQFSTMKNSSIFVEHSNIAQSANPIHDAIAENSKPVKLITGGLFLNALSNLLKACQHPTHNFVSLFSNSTPTAELAAAIDGLLSSVERDQSIAFSKAELMQLATINVAVLAFIKIFNDLHSQDCSRNVFIYLTILQIINMYISCRSHTTIPHEIRSRFAEWMIFITYRNGVIACKMPKLYTVIRLNDYNLEFLTAAIKLIISTTQNA